MSHSKRHHRITVRHHNHISKPQRTPELTVLYALRRPHNSPYIQTGCRVNTFPAKRRRVHTGTDTASLCPRHYRLLTAAAYHLHIGIGMRRLRGKPRILPMRPPACPRRRVRGINPPPDHRHQIRICQIKIFRRISWRPGINVKSIICTIVICIHPICLCPLERNPFHLVRTDDHILQQHNHILGHTLHRSPF